jgi:hypothetical protein
MIKHEIKIPFHNGEELKTLIQKSYFEEGDRGKLLGKKNFIKINDDVNHAIFKGLNNITVKITNEDVIDGSMRFVVEEKSDEIRLYPISIYALPDGEKYIFY